jgi:dolichol-phosphate mannosyltransferase
VIVVDDDSRDGTEEVVSAAASEDARVRLLVRHGHRGLSGAVLQGWRHTDATILGAMDADCQHPPDILPNLIASIASGQDLAIASRYVHGSRPGWNPIRQLLSFAAITAARPLQQVSARVTDPLSGFFLVRRQCIENILFQASGFKLLLEILVRGPLDRVEEIPFVFGARHAGRSKMSAKVAGDYLGLLGRLYWERFVVAPGAPAQFRRLKAGQQQP